MDCRHTDKTFYWFTLSRYFAVIPRGRENKIVIRQSVACRSVVNFAMLPNVPTTPTSLSQHSIRGSSHTLQIYYLFCFIFFSLLFLRNYIINYLNSLYLISFFCHFLPSSIRFLLLQSPCYQCFI